MKVLVTSHPFADKRPHELPDRLLKSVSLKRLSTSSGPEGLAAREAYSTGTAVFVNPLCALRFAFESFAARADGRVEWGAFYR
ncbi:hypothetical protein, partial [Halomonas sp. WWR20]